MTLDYFEGLKAELRLEGGATVGGEHGVLWTFATEYTVSDPNGRLTLPLDKHQTNSYLELSYQYSRLTIIGIRAMYQWNEGSGMLEVDTGLRNVGVGPCIQVNFVAASAAALDSPYYNCTFDTLDVTIRSVAFVPVPGAAALLLSGLGLGGVLARRRAA